MDPFSDMALFVRIVAAGGLSAAGRQVGLSPAVMSARLARLEDRLGVRLLHRSTRRISLTPEGSEFHERAVQILADVAAAEAAVSRGTEQARGLLRVTAPAGFGRRHVAPILPDFLDRHTELRVHLSLSDRVVDLVDEGFDVGVRIARLVEGELIARRLAANRRVVCAAPAYLAARGVPTAPADLANHSCLVLEGQRHWTFHGPAGDVAARLEARVESNDGEALRVAALGGLGLVLRSEWEVGADLRAGRLVAVLEGHDVVPDVGIHAVYPSRRHLAAKVRAFVDFLVERFSPVPPWERIG